MVHVSCKSNIVLKKGQDSEDAHRRDSMNAELENQLCRLSEKL